MNMSHFFKVLFIICLAIWSMNSQDVIAETVTTVGESQVNINEPVPSDSKTPLSEITAQEESKRKTINITYENYHGYPFAIRPGTSLDFFLELPQDQEIKAEIFSYWVKEDNTVIPPEYDLEETVSMEVLENHSTIILQRFLTQTGIKFLAKKKTRYCLKFHNLPPNKYQKMIEIAISYLHPSTDHLVEFTPTFKNTQQSTTTLHNELVARIVHIQQAMVMEQTMRDKLQGVSSSYLKYSIWEVCSIILLMIVQLIVLKKVLQNGFSSVV